MSSFRLRRSSDMVNMAVNIFLKNPPLAGAPSGALCGPDSSVGIGNRLIHLSALPVALQFRQWPSGRRRTALMRQICPFVSSSVLYIRCNDRARYTRAQVHPSSKGHCRAREQISLQPSNLTMPNIKQRLVRLPVAFLERILKLNTFKCFKIDGGTDCEADTQQPNLQ